MGLNNMEARLVITKTKLVQYELQDIELQEDASPNEILKSQHIAEQRAKIPITWE